VAGKGLKAERQQSMGRKCCELRETGRNCHDCGKTGKLMMRFRNVHAIKLLGDVSREWDAGGILRIALHPDLDRRPPGPSECPGK